MRTSRHILTRSRLGLDKRVWLSMAILIAVSAGLLAYKIADAPACVPFDIRSSGSMAGAAGHYFSGTEVGFSVPANGKNTVAWDFGDRSQETGGISTHHVFMEPGIYHVRATLNGRCMSETDIAIHEPAPPAAGGGVQEESLIIGPDAAEAGKPVRYMSSIKALSYEWAIQDNPSFPIQKGEAATYTFKSSGTLVLTLKLHGPNKTARKMITVTATAGNSRPAPAPAMPKAAAPAPSRKQGSNNTGTAFPTLDGPVEVETGGNAADTRSTAAGNGSDPDFVRMLNKAVEGKEDIKSINALLCRGGATKVLANDSDWDTVSGFYEKIKGNKAYTIAGVRLVRDDQRCITVLKVSFKKKKFGIF